MARIPKTPPVPEVFTEAKGIEDAYESFNRFAREMKWEDFPSPPPLRQFKVGDNPKYGNLQNCVVLDIIFGGKGYLIRCDWQPSRDCPKPSFPYQYRVCYWTSVQPQPDRTKTDAEYTSRSKWDHFSNCGVDSLIHYVEHGGLVCDPAYQRGYVWSAEDKESYLETLFEGGDLGRFILLRNSGYNYKSSNEIKSYLTLDGKSINVPMPENYYMELVDGQQRCTTLWRFLNDMLPYKGVYFSEMPFRDQVHCHSSMVLIATISRENITEKEILELFLKVNKGVPQTTEHLDNIRNKLASMGK